MNTKILFCSVIMPLLFTIACSVKEEDNVKETATSPELEFVAESAEGQTKTALQADEKSIWWSPADEISIFYGASEGCKFTSTNTEEVAKTVFRGTLDAFTGETEAGDFNYFWAVYPYSAAVSCDGNSVVAYLSDQQVGKAGSFAPNTNIAIAKSLGLSLGFYNTCSWFRFSVKKEGVKRVIFRGNNNEDVAGKFSISMDSNVTPTAPTVVDGKKEIVLTMPNDGTFTVGEMYYITLLPQVFQNGFTVTFETDGESGSRSISSQATYLRSKYNTGVDFDKNVVYSPQPFTITSTGITSVGINKSGTPDDIVLEYKKGDGDWTSYTIGSSIDLADGQTLQFRAGVSGNDKFSSDYANYYYVVASGLGTINVSGNIMSLLDRSLERTTLTSAIFNHLFKDCSKLVDASNLVLPATTLAADCYYWMFSRCTSLTTAPALPATTLADNCYESMFLECSSLTTAPALPATTLAKECYCDMFSDCTSLTTAPALPATTMRTGCYCDMFRHCTSLTTAPALPATTLAKECYSAMFIGCSSLSTAPELPASTLSTYCYESMFSDCTNLITAPELPATSLESGCYEMMFYGCSNLSYIKALFTSNPSYGQYTSGWVSGVSATGTFVKNSSATWDVSGNNGVPSGWTVLSAIPSPEAIDLGLPSGIKWASFNIGASAPEEYGDYYAWGEVEPYYSSQDPLTWKDGKTGYNWASYKWCNGFYDNKLTRYCPLDKTSYWDGVGSPDDMTKFSDNNYVDDVAWAILGGNWHIPTDEEWTELRTQCTWTWTTMNEVKGWLIAADNGNSIFLPRAGNWENTVKDMAYGKYWSSSLRSTYPAESMCVRFSSSSFDQVSNNRCNGYSIRPVIE